MCAKLALSFAGGTISPTVFGPMIRIRCGFAASSIFWRRPFASVSPAVMTQAALQPSLPRSPTIFGTVRGGVTITARSGTSGRSDIRFAQGSPCRLSCLGFTGQTGPSKPPSMMLRITTEPTDPSRSDAPITATERGARTLSRLRIVIGTPPFVRSRTLTCPGAEANRKPTAVAGELMTCACIAHANGRTMHAAPRHNTSQRWPGRNDAREMVPENRTIRRH